VNWHKGPTDRRHHGVVTATTAAVIGPGALSRGQVTTLLVGIGLDLLREHSAGGVFGPIHPAHVWVDARGRPGLRPGVVPPPGWTPHDDWVGLLRFGRAMGRPDQTGALSWWAVGRLEGTELLRWLLDWADPEPLPP
jgi:hypothetical protein